MDNHHAIPAKTHYFYGHCQRRTVKLPEGIPISIVMVDMGYIVYKSLIHFRMVSMRFPLCCAMMCHVVLDDKPSSNWVSHEGTHMLSIYDKLRFPHHNAIGSC